MEKTTDMWRVNNILVNKLVKEEIKGEIKIYIKPKRMAITSCWNVDFKKYFFKMGTIVCYFFNNLVYSITVVAIFPFCPPSSSPPRHPTAHPHTVVRVCGSLRHVLWLIPSPSLHHSPSPLSSGSPQCVPCFHVSGPFLFLVTLFCSLDSSYKWDDMKTLGVQQKWW